MEYVGFERVDVVGAEAVECQIYTGLEGQWYGELREIRGLQGPGIVAPLKEDLGTTGKPRGITFEHSVQECCHARVFGMEAMGADIEDESVVVEGAGEPAYGLVSFDHSHLAAGFLKQHGAGETGDSAAHHHHGTIIDCRGRHSLSCPVAYSTRLQDAIVSLATGVCSWHLVEE